MTIPLHEVTDALLALLRTAAPTGAEVGDGEPPQTTADRAVAWLTRQSAPRTMQGYGGGESHRFVRYRVSTEASDQGLDGNAARAAAEIYADTLRVALLDPDNRPSGDTWQTSAITHDASMSVGGERTFAVHDDYVVHVASTA